MRTLPQSAGARPLFCVSAAALLCLGLAPRKRVYIDAGHGEPGNTGNRSCECEAEQDFTLRVAEDLARRLEATGRFRVLLSRPAGKEVSYPRRLAAAAKFGAQAIVSIHSDVRGMPEPITLPDGRRCWQRHGGDGFAVLWSDETSPLRHRREKLARAIAWRLAGAGFLPYDGEDYPGLYDGDATRPGLFVDRHRKGQRIYFLRRPSMPSVIIETHQAFDPEEVQHWKVDSTLAAFAQAVEAALRDAL